MTDLINRLADGFRAPRVYYAAGSVDNGAWNEPSTQTVTNTASKLDLNAIFSHVSALPPTNKVLGSDQTFITLQPRGGNVYLRLRHKDDAGAAGTTAGDAGNGVKLLADQMVHFEIVDPYTVLDVISDVASQSLYIWKSSEPV